MNRARYLAARLQIVQAIGAAAALRAVAERSGLPIAMREAATLRNSLSTLERLLEADRDEARRTEPVDPAEWGGEPGAWASPRLPLALAEVLP